MQSQLQQIRSRLGTRGIAASAAIFVALLAALLTPQLFGSRVASALSTLEDANGQWLWVAGVGFVLAVVGSAGSWRSAIGLCGGRISLTDACARYGAGSLVNTFIPARAGDALRIALFSRVLPNKERIWTSGSAFAALGAARAPVLAALVIAGAAVGALPLWPLLIAFGLVAAGVATTVAVRGRRPVHRASHLFDAFRALASDPVAAARLVAWIAISTAGRLAAATAVGAALGINHPFAAALVIVPTLDVAGMIPVTPGNVGVTSAAIAVAFQSQGVSFTNGLAAGIAFHAIETAVSIMFGVSSLVWLAPYRTPGMRRVVLLGAAVSWVLGIAGAFSATVLAPLV